MYTFPFEIIGRLHNILVLHKPLGSNRSENYPLLIVPVFLDYKHFCFISFTLVTQHRRTFLIFFFFFKIIQTVSKLL